MSIFKIVGIIFAGLVGVVATEAGVVAWLTYAPASLDLTGNYFTLTILPVAVVVAILAALLLWKLLAANPLRNCLIFSAVWVAAEASMLIPLGNPSGVVATYALIIAGSCAIVFVFFARMFWARATQ
jgi:hypothetical protein